jgi:hypothetical protein
MNDEVVGVRRMKRRWRRGYWWRWELWRDTDITVSSFGDRSTTTVVVAKGWERTEADARSSGRLAKFSTIEEASADDREVTR